MTQRRPPRPALEAVPAAAGAPFISGAERAARWRREAGLFLGAYALYSLARGVSRGDELDALRNAAHIVSLQAELGLNVERQVQDWVTGLQVMAVLGTLYLLAQLVVVPVALVAVYRLRRQIYPLLRTTLLAAWLIAIPIYAIFPTAPPRLAGIGIVDSVTRESLVPLDAPFIQWFYNPVAAVPSMHSAFAVAVGVGLAAALRRPLLRIAGLMWGPLVILIVVATGNHFILDVVAGLVVVGVAFAAAVALHGPAWRYDQEPGPAFPFAVAPFPAEGPARPLRVALVCPYAWDVPGGVVAQVRQMAASLRRLGHQVDVLAPADAPVDEPGVIRLGGTIGVRHNGSVGRVALSPRANLRAVRLVRRGGYDVVHLHEPLVPPCLAVLLRSDRPMVGTFHMYGPDSKLYRALAPLGRLAVRRLHHRTAVSEAARACAARFLRGDYEVIPNGIAPHQAEAITRADERFRVLFVGRTDPRKGLGKLLRAMPRLPEARLDLVGVEPEELLALHPDPPEHWIAHGRVSEQRRRELLDHADVMVAPSLEGESFGLVLVEAMAAGVPVVASSIPGYLPVLAGHGPLVPAGDVEALTATLEDLALNRGQLRRLGEGGRRAAQRFDWSRVTPRLLAAYTRAIATQRTAGGGGPSGGPARTTGRLGRRAARLRRHSPRVIREPK